MHALEFRGIGRLVSLVAVTIQEIQRGNRELLTLDTSQDFLPGSGWGGLLLGLHHLGEARFAGGGGHAGVDDLGSGYLRGRHGGGELIFHRFRHTPAGSADRSDGSL